MAHSAQSTAPEREAIRKLREAWRSADQSRRKIELARSRQMDDVAAGHIGFAAQHIQNALDMIEEVAALMMR